jgi:hypothetical protein
MAFLGPDVAKSEGAFSLLLRPGYAHISIGWVGCRPESESGKETQVNVGALRDGGNDNARTCMRARGAYPLRYWKPLSPARSNEVGLRVARPGRHRYTDWLKCSSIGSVSYPIKIDILDCSRQLDGSSQVPNGSVRGQQHGASLSRPLCMLDRPGNVGQVIGRRYME